MISSLVGDEVEKQPRGVSGGEHLPIYRMVVTKVEKDCPCSARRTRVAN